MKLRHRQYLLALLLTLSLMPMAALAYEVKAGDTHEIKNDKTGKKEKIAFAVTKKKDGTGYVPDYDWLNKECCVVKKDIDKKASNAKCEPDGSKCTYDCEGTACKPKKTNCDDGSTSGFDCTP